jgi:hypothetical protein
MGLGRLLAVGEASGDVTMSDDVDIMNRGIGALCGLLRCFVTAPS